jgi:hypothetical protein
MHTHTLSLSLTHLHTYTYMHIHTRKQFQFKTKFELPGILESMEDDQRVCVTAALEAMARLLEELGVAGLGEHLGAVCDVTEMVLKGEAPCQVSTES